jgi:hypothetical protein
MLTECTDRARRRWHLQGLRLHLLRRLRVRGYRHRQHARTIHDKQRDLGAICIQEGREGRAPRRRSRAHACEAGQSSWCHPCNCAAARTSLPGSANRSVFSPQRSPGDDKRRRTQYPWSASWTIWWLWRPARRRRAPTPGITSTATLRPACSST